MSNAFGFNGFVGFAEESTWGTPVSATSFIEILESNMKLNQSRQFKKTLGSASQRRSVPSKRNVSGSVKLPAIYQGSEFLFKHLMGSVSSAQIGVTGVYRHTFALAAALPTGLTVVQNPDATGLGLTACEQFSGCQISKCTLSQSLENFLELSFDFEGKDKALIAKPTPTFPTFYGIQFDQLGTFTLGGTTVNAEMVEISFEQALNTDRFKLGSVLRKGLQRSDVRKVTGKITLEFETLALYTAFEALSDIGAFSAIWTGGIAAGSTPYRLALSAPSTYIQSWEAPVKDAGVIKVSANVEFAAGDNTEFGLILDNLLTSVT